MALRWHPDGKQMAIRGHSEGTHLRRERFCGKMLEGGAQLGAHRRVPDELGILMGGVEDGDGAHGIVGEGLEEDGRHQALDQGKDVAGMHAIGSELAQQPAGLRALGVRPSDLRHRRRSPRRGAITPAAQGRGWLVAVPLGFSLAPLSAEVDDEHLGAREEVERW